MQLNNFPTNTASISIEGIRTKAGFVWFIEQSFKHKIAGKGQMRVRIY